MDKTQLLFQVPPWHLPDAALRPARAAQERAQQLGGRRRLHPWTFRRSGDRHLESKKTEKNKIDRNRAEFSSKIPRSYIY